MADCYGFTPKVCRPYRARPGWAQTKGKVERFNRSLKDSFVTPLTASLKTAGLIRDVAAANGPIGPWLQQKANERIHATTQAMPAERLRDEQAFLLPLPIPDGPAIPVVSAHFQQHGPMRFESVQHALAIYDSLLETGHESAI